MLLWVPLVLMEQDRYAYRSRRCKVIGTSGSHPADLILLYLALGAKKLIPIQLRSTIDPRNLSASGSQGY